MRQRYIDFVPTMKNGPQPGAPAGGDSVFDTGDSRSSRGGGVVSGGAGASRGSNGDFDSFSASSNFNSGSLGGNSGSLGRNSGPLGGARSKRKMVDGVVRVMPTRKVTRTVSSGMVRPVEGARVQRKVVTRIEEPGATRERTERTERVQRTERASFSITSETMELGVVEDLNARFVKTEVPKRPLSRGLGLRGRRKKKTEAKGESKEEFKEGLEGEFKEEAVSREKKAEASRDSGSFRAVRGVSDKGTNGVSSRGVGGAFNRGISGVSDKGVSGVSDRSTGRISSMASTGATYVPPKSKFISQAKVEKRPLSKTVYQKKIAVPKEEPKGPITIIAKPEKQNHAGLIITVILTIILGAAAGTIAFLLLPK